MANSSPDFCVPPFRAGVMRTGLSRIAPAYNLQFSPDLVQFPSANPQNSRWKRCRERVAIFSRCWNTMKKNMPAQTIAYGQES